MLVQCVKVNGYRGHDLARIMGSRGWNGAEAGASECQREYKWVDPICLPQTTCHSTHTYARARDLLHMFKTEEEKVGVLGFHRNQLVVISPSWPDGELSLSMTLPLRLTDSPKQLVPAYFVSDGQVMKVGDRITTLPPESLTGLRLNNNSTINQTKCAKTTFI